MSTIGLLTPSTSFKPSRYPWALELWRQQNRVHWLPEEVPLGEDVKDWENNLNEGEKNLLTQIFRFFTQADLDVQDNYMERYAQVFKPHDVKMMLAAFAASEATHVVSYALLLETIGMPDSEFEEFKNYKAMRDKHDYMAGCNMDNPREIAKTLAIFGAFGEGLQLFASFAMLFNFPRFNKMKGMGQIVSWSVRDEAIHCEGITRLFREFVKESGCMDDSLKEEIYEACRTVVRMEDAFVDLAFEMGPVQGMCSEDIKGFVRYVADQRLAQLNLEPIYNVKTNPLPWFAQMAFGVEHANFFEARATEYSKGATTGTWEGEDGVWARFEKIQQAKSTV